MAILLILSLNLLSPYSLSVMSIIGSSSAFFNFIFSLSMLYVVISPNNVILQSLNVFRCDFTTSSYAVRRPSPEPGPDAVAGIDSSFPC